MPHWFFSLPWDTIQEAAEEHKTPWKLLGALTMAESAGNQWASRYEPGYRYLVRPSDYANALSITPATEEMHQKTSWGLTQVMGGLARELGFNGYLPELCKPKSVMRLTCLQLKKLASKYSTQSDIIAAYNAGSVVRKSSGVYINERYVDTVSGYLRELDSVLRL